VSAGLVLVTHEHRDHNGVEAIAGSPAVLRSTAGRLESPVGEVLAIAAEQAATIAAQLRPRYIVPMHYRTHRIGFLEPPDAFLERMQPVERPGGPRFDTEALPGQAPLTVVPSAA
jgi:L-ascorbate metabolism protein UlaG (beta-lactamase superfamily)